MFVVPKSRYEKCKRPVYCILLQRAAMVAKKLLGDDKITACVKQIRLRGLYEKFRIEKHSLVKHSDFLINVCY